MWQGLRVQWCKEGRNDCGLQWSGEIHGGAHLCRAEHPRTKTSKGEETPGLEKWYKGSILTTTNQKVQKHPHLGGDVFKSLRISHLFPVNFCFYPLFSTEAPVTCIHVASIVLTSQVGLRIAAFLNCHFIKFESLPSALGFTLTLIL